MNGRLVLLIASLAILGGCDLVTSTIQVHVARGGPVPLPSSVTRCPAASIDARTVRSYRLRCEPYAIDVHVSEIAALRIIAPTLHVGDHGVFEVVAEDAEGHVLLLPDAAPVHWTFRATLAPIQLRPSSPAPTIAARHGYAEALAPGTSDIEAELSGHSAYLTFTVLPLAASDGPR